MNLVHDARNWNSALVRLLVLLLLIVGVGHAQPGSSPCTAIQLTGTSVGSAVSPGSQWFVWLCIEDGIYGMAALSSAGFGTFSLSEGPCSAPTPVASVGVYQNTLTQGISGGCYQCTAGTTYFVNVISTSTSLLLIAPQGYQTNSDRWAQTIIGSSNGTALAPAVRYVCPGTSFTATWSSPQGTATQWDAAFSFAPLLPNRCQVPFASTPTQAINLDLFAPLHWRNGTHQLIPFTGPVAMEVPVAPDVMGLTGHIQSVALDPGHVDGLVISAPTTIVVNPQVQAAPQTLRETFHCVPGGITICGTTYQGLIERDGIVTFLNGDLDTPTTVPPSTSFNPLSPNPTLAIWSATSPTPLAWPDQAFAHLDTATSDVVITLQITDGTASLGSVTARVNATTGATSITYPPSLSCTPPAGTTICWSPRVGFTCGISNGATDPGAPAPLSSGTAASPTDATYFDIQGPWAGTIAFSQGDPSIWTVM